QLSVKEPARPDEADARQIVATSMRRSVMRALTSDLSLEPKPWQAFFCHSFGVTKRFRIERIVRRRPRSLEALPEQPLPGGPTHLLLLASFRAIVSSASAPR